jgi:hypothetical protein
MGFAALFLCWSLKKIHANPGIAGIFAETVHEIHANGLKTE